MMNFSNGCVIGALGMGLLFSSCSESSPSGDAPKAEEQAVVREVSLTVPTITCASCLAKIRKEVIQVPGVVSMGGDPRTKKVVVRLGASAAEGDTAIREAIAKAGFEASADQ